MNRMISLFKALSDKNRLRVIAALTGNEELCACQITELLGVTGATASRHMGILINAGLIESRKEGRWVYYRLNTSVEDFTSVLEWMKSEFEKSQDIENDFKTLKKITAYEPEDLCRKQRGEECCPE